MPLTIDPTYADVEVHLVLHCLLNHTNRQGYAVSPSGAHPPLSLDEIVSELEMPHDDVVDCLQTLVDLDALVEKAYKKGDALVVLKPCQCSKTVMHEYALARMLLEGALHENSVKGVDAKGTKPKPPKGSGPGGGYPIQDDALVYAYVKMDNIIRGVFPTDSGDLDGPVARHVDWCGPDTVDKEKNSWSNTLVYQGERLATEEIGRNHLTKVGKPREPLGSPHRERQPLGCFEHTFLAEGTEVGISVPPKGAQNLEGESLPSLLVGGHIKKKRGHTVGPDSAAGLAIYFSGKARDYDKGSRTNCKALAHNFADDLRVPYAPQAIRESIELFFQRKPRATHTPLWQQYLGRRRPLLEDANKAYEMEAHRYDADYWGKYVPPETEDELNRYNPEYWAPSKKKVAE